MDRRRSLALGLALGSLVALSGCSIERALWGADGARVIEATEQLIAAASSGDQDSLVCKDATVDFGDAQTWDGLSAGEPEQFVPAASVDLDASWRINLEGTGPGGNHSQEAPTDVLYREAGTETGTGLCVADVIWQTVNVR